MFGLVFFGVAHRFKALVATQHLQRATIGKSTGRIHNIIERIAFYVREQASNGKGTFVFFVGDCNGVGILRIMIGKSTIAQPKFKTAFAANRKSGA
jgi:hypothetical protein